jgi:hypothetical protein
MTLSLRPVLLLLLQRQQWNNQQAGLAETRTNPTEWRAQWHGTPFSRAFSPTLLRP